MSAPVPVPACPRLPQLRARPRGLSARSYARYGFVLQVVDSSTAASAPWAKQFAARRAAGRIANAEPAAIDIAPGCRAASMAIADRTPFALHEQVRCALAEAGFAAHMKLAVDVRVGSSARAVSGELACAALAACGPQPALGSKPAAKPQQEIDICGASDGAHLRCAAVRAQASHEARWLALLPGNILNPDRLLDHAESVAQDCGLQVQRKSVRELAAAGAGAFAAVAGEHGPGGLLRMTWQPRGRPRARLALVGKGVTFDTGGLNVKPHRSMLNMHADMAGAAAVIVALRACAQLKLPLQVDGWIAAADNRVFREAYAPGDVVRAANGTAIEIVHTDAEGRMLLADAIHFAAQRKTQGIVSFATLTGSMVAALGNRISGVLGSDGKLVDALQAAGAACGERLVAFPLAADYAAQLDSDIADVKQCAVAGEADHILAGLLLKRFAGKRSFAHVDLAASHCEGGLGASACAHTGFGAALAVQLLLDAARS